MASDNTIVKNIVNELKEKSENVDRTNQKGLINDKTGSSIILDENGNVTIAPSKTVQYKMKYSYEFLILAHFLIHASIVYFH